MIKIINKVTLVIITAFFLTSCGETKLSENLDYIIEVEDGRVKVTNYSDHEINIVKIVGTECGGKSTSIDWDKHINYLSGSTIYRGYTTDVIGLGEYKCFYNWVGYK